MTGNLARTMPIAAWAFAAGAAVALALALPGAGWWPLVFLAPGLLLEALARTSGLKPALALGLAAGTLHWLITVRWVVDVMHHYGRMPLIPALLCLLAMAALLGLSWALLAVALARVVPAVRPWLLPVMWIALEAWRQAPPYVFPWNPVASAFAHRPELLGSLPVWGASGLGWTALLAGAGAWAVLRPATRISGAAAVAVAVAATLVASALAPAAAPAGPPLRMAALQPGTSLEEKWNPDNWQGMVETVWRLSREAADDGAEVLLWPESAVPFRLEDDPAFRLQVVSLAAELDVAIVLNSIGRAAGEGYTNSAYVVSAAGVAPQRYDKVRLVPFGEYVPGFARALFPAALVREVGGFTPGSSLRPLPLPVPAGIAICYEIVFADLVARQVREGAQLLVTLTNDGWYGASWAPPQHWAQARLRAVETRRWLARAALTGISGMADPNGRAVSLEIGRTGVVTVDVVPCAGLTPRARWGDWWAVLCAAATAALVLPRRFRAPRR